ncbi:hypothetical protein CEW92_03475 [Bacillaceae bacterium SAS-127]|nr:hypothetical protein CEW92_03475 [Bacillaceae bacterium SAS-127]
MEAIYVYKNRPGLSAVSILFCIMGLVTILFFQNFEIKTLSALIEYLASEQDKEKLYTTWISNLGSAALLFGIGFRWIKEALEDSYFSEDTTVSKIVCAATGILMILWSFTFLSFVLTKLLGIVLGVVIVLALVNSSKK